MLPPEAWLEHLRVERRASPRTLQAYADALARLRTLTSADGIELAAVQQRCWTRRA